MKAMKALIGLVGMALVLPGAGLGQAATKATVELPAASVLRERHIDAIGGRAALERHRSSHALGKFDIAAQGIHGSLEIFAAAPNNLLVEIDVPGIGLVRNGYNGEIGWTIHPATGPMVMDGRQLDQMRQQADFYGVLQQERYIASTETVEEVEFAGRPSYRVKVITLWDEEYSEFFDRETGLLAGNIREQESPMGAIEVTTVTTDYRDFGGISAPTKVVQRLLGLEQTFTVERVEYDQVDESLFELPSEIRTLVSTQ